MRGKRGGEGEEGKREGEREEGGGYCVQKLEGTHSNRTTLRMKNDVFFTKGSPQCVVGV